VGFIGLKDCGKVFKKPDFDVISSGDTLFSNAKRIPLHVMNHRSV
jgi:hypothetical protein